ncbi:uncharacterized protein LOC113290682 [Papaver somniferum]|uniref:uncharacterized protein LOC113290682 n=1 Tax=Papaver somniferum TaxID=3469 RepID=UPI000E6F60BE|nr:uncharacterized protein LOC113290682 [Papaver somniferum]
MLIRALRVEYGYFAAIIVDIDFSKPFPKLVIDDEDFSEGFHLDYDFLNKPEFCDHCKSVGHTLSQCRSARYKDLEKLHDAEEDALKCAALKAEMDELKDYWKKEKYVKPKDKPPPLAYTGGGGEQPLDPKDNNDGLCIGGVRHTGRRTLIPSPSSSIAGDGNIADIPHAFPESASTNLTADSVPLRELVDDAATISLDLEKEEEELYKVYDEQKKIADDMSKAADLAKIEQDALLAKLQNTRQLLMAKKRQEEEKRAQEEDDSEDEEESIEADALPIKEKPPDSLQSASTSNVETEAEKLEWSAAKDEEDKLKRELAEKKKLDNLAKKGAVKIAPKKKSKPGAKSVEDDGQVVRRGRSQTHKEDDKGSASPSRIMPHVFCNVRFVRSLKLVDFCEDVITNEADGEKGNIWILWRNTLLRPDILSTSKQAITVNFVGDFIATVHASYNPVVRKRLWRKLGLGFISIPWLVLGDFNCVLRLEEKKGARPIKEVYMNEFRSWIFDNDLVEADAIGKKYTWSNCRSGAQRIIFKHDRAVVNDAWCYKYANWRCKALPRLVEENWNLDLNGAPPFIFTFKLKRLKEVLNIWNKTTFGDVQFRLKQAELKLETENDLLDYDPADEFQFLKVADAKKDVDDVRMELEIMLNMKSRVTCLEDGDQNTCFFHNSICMRRSQNTISELKVSNDTTLFLQDEIKDFIVNHYQAKFNGGDVHIDPVLFDIEHGSISVAESVYMDAIPSLEEVRVAVFDLGADSAPAPDGFTCSFYRQCRDISSRNLFNAIANCWPMRKIPNGINSSFIIMATRLGTVLNKLISKEQVAFMKGRNIHENIALASELINEINPERKHGNVGLKLDIAQAFDTVSWDFIAEVFRQYGFSDSWCMWVLNILSSARISVMINGCPEGYFSITRGLRQGDPLSPLIFVLIEDVLSRNLSKLFANHSMNVMVNKKGEAPTHLLFADDILIFCRGNLHSLQNLKNMFVFYERASGQCVNYAKSKFYFGGDRISRAIAISNYFGMERAMFPAKYLGIQLKPGIVRHIHVRQVVEKIMDKLTGWKVERAIRNFLWSGDAEKHKYFTVLYDDLCLSKREGGLGIKKLNNVNRAMLMKLWISIRDSNKIWARFLRAKYFKINGNLINYKLGSSVFPGIRLVYNFVHKHTRSIIGNGVNTSLFFDNWCGDFSIAQRLGITSKVPNDFKAKVSDIIFDGVWVIPEKQEIG